MKKPADPYLSRVEPDATYLALPCPTCGAKKGELCELNSGQKRHNSHPARRAIAYGASPHQQLMPAGNLHIKGEIMPFRWRCSGCGEQFVLPNFPTGVDDARYATDLGIILNSFKEHCTVEHSSLAAAAGM